MEKFKHPELKENEVFLMNSSNYNLSTSTYKTIRKGLIAYDIYGNVIENCFPLFVSEYEYLHRNDLF